METGESRAEDRPRRIRRLRKRVAGNPSGTAYGSWGVAIPLGFSRFNKGEVRAAKLAVDRSESEYDAVRYEVETEVRQAFSEYQSLRKQVSRFRSGILTESEKLLEGAIYKYQRGESDLIEVLIARRTYNDIQEQYLVKCGEYARARVELERACGTWNL